MNNNQLIQKLIDEREKLGGAVQVVEKRLRNSPEGSVRVVKHGKGYQFYLRKTSSEKSGTYVSSAERESIIKLVQKQYDRHIKEAAEKQIKVIDRFLKGYDTESLKNVYTMLPEGRKILVNPVELPDDEYVQNWLSYEYEKMSFSEDDPEHFTSKGERVRSKSEVMIADALGQSGLPYRYECPLELGETVVHPDFTILRMVDRKVLYWEHLGMMDDQGYCQKALKKLRLYEANRIFPGINLIVTMETSVTPINMTVIKNMIETYCILGNDEYSNDEYS